eukprot:72034_1
MVETETPDDYIDEMYDFIEYHKDFYMRDMDFILAWNCYRLLIRTSNSLECRNFVNNRRFGTHPEWFKWCIHCMEMFANSLNDYNSWLSSGITHRRSKKEYFKNCRLEQLWDTLDSKIVPNELESGKIVYDISKVTFLMKHQRH